LADIVGREKLAVLGQHFMSHERFLSANFSCVHDHKMDDSSDDKALATTALFLCMRKRKKRNLTMWNVTIDITEVDSSPLWSSPRHSAAWIFQTEGTDQSQLVISANMPSCFLTFENIFLLTNFCRPRKIGQFFYDTGTIFLSRHCRPIISATFIAHVSWQHLRGPE